MNFLTMLIVAAMLATVAVLVLGISSMVRDGEVAHVDSEHWMGTRVGLQAFTIAALVVALILAS